MANFIKWFIALIKRDMSFCKLDEEIDKGLQEKIKKEVEKGRGEK